LALPVGELIKSSRETFDDKTCEIHGLSRTDDVAVSVGNCIMPVKGEDRLPLWPGQWRTQE
jgi:hypothetical protein